MKKTRKTLTQTLAVVCAGALLIGAVTVNYDGSGASKTALATAETIQSVDGGIIDTRTEDLFDSDKVYKLTDTVTADTEISVILSLDSDTLLDMYNASDCDMTFGEYSTTPAALKAKNKVIRSENELLKKLNRSGVDYRMGETYDTLVNGFEVTIKAGDFDELAKAVPEATLIVGEEYERCVTEVVTNEVDVYETGIFDSSNSKYSGDGVVVAVLDTGLDYTHSAFAVENFEYETLAYSRTADGSAKGDIDSHVGSLHAATTTADLTSSDVYINEKVPYQYDYADKDTDVFPIDSDHGTHVSGIIAGHDKEITGVAPSAQLMMMKVFSDTSSGAKQSWILAALEDCVKLDVDVINMSLGSSCGFSREADKEETNKIYDAIEEAGISMVCAAGNDYNSTRGSDKNGGLGLTSNPETSTVSSPSSYDATMSVASVSGVASNYMLYEGNIIYFNEATDSTATTRSFFDDILGRYEDLYGVDTSTGSFDIPYEVIPGLGRNSDYSKSDYTGEIVLVKRGTTTFEEKIRIAMSKNALGIIIYNNVSGTISMSIGANADAAACSISQDDGEMLVAGGGGTLTISRSQEAGPFMSDFSSWGPTSDLKIKPEITAHGGDIYSCIPGGGYDRLSGTSMATPNMAGVTALIRQYVKANEGNAFHISESSDTYKTDVTAIVNKLEMSTADILYNTNGLPYSVRKQGAGLVNLYSAQKSDAYISTLDSGGNETDKAKIELGDDAGRSGDYEMSFIVRNISSSAVRYDVGAIVQTEGVSATYTSHGDTTVSEEGETLSGAVATVTSITGGTKDGNTISVAAGGEATVTVEIVLSESDKEYLDESFENGMYVEGFITLEQLGGTNSDDFVDLSVPYLAFYGDWAEAPIFDEEYYDTNADEINAGLNDEDKLMADGYATRVVGGLYDDYIAYMGTYYFVQDPSAVQVAADRNHIAMSNQSDGSSNYNINNLDYVYAGLLRNAAEMDLVITEDATGKVIYADTVLNQRKSYGASSIYTSAVDLDNVSAKDLNLKNNTQYTVTLSAYIDYGRDDDGNLDKMHQDEVNKRNTFSFPLYIDYEAPVLTDVEFRQEYDSTTKKTSLFVDLSVYDNHYAMAAQIGQVEEYKGDENYLFSLSTFGGYATPISSSFNSTTIVSFELTDYINDLKNSAGYILSDDGSGGGTYTLSYNTNSFIVVLYDYAMNSAIYEVRLPDDVISMYFDGTYNNTKEVDLSGDVAAVTLELNETLDLTEILNVYPSTTWVQTFDYSSADDSKVRVVNQTVLALDYTTDGPVVVTVTGYTSEGNEISAELAVTVEGNSSRYTLPVVNSFSIKSYYVEKAFYAMSSDEREIGYTGYTYTFDSNPSLSMFPSECVDVTCDLQTYFPEYTYISFSVSNSSVAEVYTRDDGVGVITAKNEGTTTVTATVYYDPTGDNPTAQRSARISITVKDPFTTNSIYLMSYKGSGDENGVVEIPDDRGITTIYQYAFSNYEYVKKDPDDEISEEDPYNTKATFIGDDTIRKVIIPEGVTEIDGYAFANLTALEEVVFPSTLTRIGYGAFYGCESLTTITFSGKNNVMFVNDQAFYGCKKLETFNFESIVAIGKYAFYRCDFTYVNLARTCQSVGEYAFYGNTNLYSVYIQADSVKLGSYAFGGCSDLQSIDINAAVIPSYAFFNCKSLTSVTLGADVTTINAYAFYGTKVSSFTIKGGNNHLSTSSDGKLIYSDGGTVLQTVVPTLSGAVTLNDNTTTISNGAFAGTAVSGVTGQKVVYVRDYAFAGCANLKSENLKLGDLVEIGANAFNNSGITSLPSVSSNGVDVGASAFAYSSLKGEIPITAAMNMGDYAFCGCSAVSKVTVEDGASVGAYAFYGCDNLESVEIGEGCVIGDYAFAQSIAPDCYSWYQTYYYMYGDDTCWEYWSLYSYAYKEETDSYVVTDPDDPEDERIVNDSIYVNATAVYYTYDITKATSGSLTTVKIGNNTAIGKGAFENCATITKLTFEGEDAAGVTIGDYAFYNCLGLKEIENSKIIKEIGAYAFSVMGDTLDLMIPESSGVRLFGSVTFAYEAAIIDGTLTVTGYRYSENYGSLKGTLDLSGVTKLGEGAFAYNEGISVVVLSSELTAIPAYAFYMCEKLTTISLGSEGADSGWADLSEVENVGAYAFAYTSIEKVALHDDMVVGDGAFYMVTTLTEARNLESVNRIGAYAFAYTSLATDVLDVSGAAYIGDYAFAYISSTSDTPMLVDFLGEKPEGEGAIEEIGENPFLGTDVEFFVTVTEMFNGETVSEETSYSYTVNGSLFVSEGVLYTTYRYGDEDVRHVLVTYPVGKTDSVYTVGDGTVRISAHAFDDNDYLEIVVLPSELTAIGDKAFYGCDDLSVVVFTSYYAPALEEEYDADYGNLIANYPAPYYTSGYYPSYGYGYWYEGLGVVNYPEWSASPNAYFYGANFVDYIGKVEDKLTMVVPVNGQQYDSFTLAQYFDTVIYGAAAATADTLAVIAMIEKLPEARDITMSDSDAVYEALAAYDALSTEQQALVTNYSKLTDAYGQILFLETQQNTGADAETGEETEKSSSSFMKDNMWGLIIALVILLAFVALLVYTILMRNRRAQAAEVQGSGEDALGAPAEDAVLSDSTSGDASGEEAESEVTLGGGSSGDADGGTESDVTLTCDSSNEKDEKDKH